MESNRDQQLWKLAKRRAHFQQGLISYALVNTMLIVIWYFTSGSTRNFWPIWPLLFWGIGLGFQYYEAYVSKEDSNLVDKEYRKLLNKQ
jgi:2TM domain